MKRFFSSMQSGFTLVETLVAITVLLLIIIGPMTVAQKGIQSAYFANEQVTATFLAQEAIEAIRVFRDDHALDVLDGGGGEDDTAEWIVSSNIHPDCFDKNVGCAYNPDSEDFESCGSNNLCKIFFDASTGRYSHSLGVESIFERRVFVEEEPGPSPDGTAAVKVVVTWEAKLFSSGPREYVLQTWLYDHYQSFEN